MILSHDPNAAFLAGDWFAFADSTRGSHFRGGDADHVTACPDNGATA